MKKNLLMICLIAIFFCSCGKKESENIISKTSSTINQIEPSIEVTKQPNTPVPTAANHSDTSNEYPDMGIITQENIYTNTFFSLRICLPKDWHFINPTTQKELLKNSFNQFEFDEKTKAGFEQMVKKGANLFTMYKYPYGQPPKDVEFNPSISCVIENWRGLKNTTPKKALNNMKDLSLKNRQFTFEFNKDIYDKKFNNKTFSVLEVKANTQNLKVNQIYYLTAIKGYGLNIVCTYINKKDLETLNNALDSIKFSD